MQSAVLVNSVKSESGLRLLEVPAQELPWAPTPPLRPPKGPTGPAHTTPQLPVQAQSPHSLEEFDVPIVQTVIHELHCIVSWKAGRRQVSQDVPGDGWSLIQTPRLSRRDIKGSRFSPDGQAASRSHRLGEACSALNSSKALVWPQPFGAPAHHVLCCERSHSGPSPRQTHHL